MHSYHCHKASALGGHYTYNFLNVWMHFVVILQQPFCING